MRDVSPAELAIRLGASVSAARKARAWSQERLAERLDVAKNYVGLVERGERLPSLSVAARFAAVLDISIDDVMFGTDSKQTKDWATGIAALAASVAPEYRAIADDILRLLAGKTPQAGRRR